MKKQVKVKSNTGKALAVGSGLVLAAAIIAGAYFLYGKNGAKNRKKVRGWMLKMKGEILEQMERLPEVSEALYTRVIEEVANRYKALNHVDSKELADIVKELKGHWASIKKQLTKKTKAVKKNITKKVKRKSAPKKTR